MKALILTNHFQEYTGSEIQALEIYQYFRKKNIDVKIYANSLGQQLIQHIDIKDIIEDVSEIKVEEFNFIWAQHAIFSMLFKNKPTFNHGIHIFSVHLSPYEIMELTAINYMKEIGATFIANSEETKDKLLEFNVDSEKIVVSYNCAPKKFQNGQIPHKINNILAISNHLPDELSKALLKLENEFSVQVIGMKHEKILISPELLNKYDLIISIGKSVQYGILNNKFIYCYDRFGGPGFLTDQNFETAKYYNFSGRGFNKKSVNQIYEEIINFKPNQYIKNIYKENFELEVFMDKLMKTPKIFLKNKDVELLHSSYPIESLFTQYYLGYNNGTQQKIKKYKNIVKVLSILILILIYVVT